MIIQYLILGTVCLFQFIYTSPKLYFLENDISIVDSSNALETRIIFSNPIHIAMEDSTVHGLPTKVTKTIIVKDSNVVE